MVSFVEQTPNAETPTPAAQQEPAVQDPAKKSCGCKERKERIQGMCDSILRNNLRSSRLSLVYYFLLIIFIILMIVYAIRKNVAE